MCFAIHNDFKNSAYGSGQTSNVQIRKNTKFIRYKPPQLFIDNVIKDYKPLQAMSVEMQFGYLRIFNFYVVGTITPTKPVSKEVGDLLIQKAKESLSLYFAPANFDIGRKNWKGLKRDNNKYLEYFKFWARINNNIIVYTIPELVDDVLLIRKNFGLLNKTKVIAITDVTKCEKEIYIQRLSKKKFN